MDRLTKRRLKIDFDQPFGPHVTPKRYLSNIELPLTSIGKPDRKKLMEIFGRFLMPTNKWIAGARPRTLPAAVAPVFVGTALRHTDHAHIDLMNALLALLVSLALQVGVNYANDYSDGIRGTDAVRVGPIRLVGSGLATATAEENAAFAYLHLCRNYRGSS
jgi:hypothetical protein